MHYFLTSRFRNVFRLLLPALLFLTWIETQAQQASEERGVPLDVVWVVDVSGSTGGILTVIREKFWELQNEMARLSPVADYRLSIICMGRPSFKKENNYIGLLSDLTDDIDAVAYPFFQLRDISSPGNYHLGHALQVAVNLSWSADPDALKVIFIAGNGAPHSGPGLKKPLKQLQELGVIINTMYFETYDNANEKADWSALAETTGGRYFPISLTEPNIVFEKAYDNDLLLEACRMINTTYVPYGEEGVNRLDDQQSLDEDAEMQGEFAFEARTFFKATALYQGKNDSWDLVDVFNKGQLQPGKVSRKHPPGVLAHMTDEELLLHVTEMSYNRGEYVSIIKMLTAKREEHMRNMREKMLVYRYGKTFFGVMNKTLVEMVEEKGYHHEF